MMMMMMMSVILKQSMLLENKSDNCNDEGHSDDES